MNTDMPLVCNQDEYVLPSVKTNISLSQIKVNIMLKASTLPTLLQMNKRH